MKSVLKTFAACIPATSSFPWIEDVNVNTPYLPGTGLPLFIANQLTADPFYIHHFSVSEIKVMTSLRASLTVFVSVDNVVMKLDGINVVEVFSFPLSHFTDQLGARCVSEVALQAIRYCFD